MIMLLATLTLFGCGKKKENVENSDFYKEGKEMLEFRIAQQKKKDLNSFLRGTNMNENVSLSMKDSILTVKIISQADADYSELVDFYHSLAKRSHVWFTGTEIRDSITNKVLARTGYGFNTPFDE